MNKIVHLSLARKEVPIRIDVVKGATTPGIDFVLDDYLPESGATARIYIKKKESEVYNNCEISDNIVTFTPTTGSFDEVGECQAQLQIIKSEDIAVSFRMWVDVEDNLIDGSAIESSNEYGALIGMTNDINVLKSEVAQIISGATPVDPDAELVDIRIAYDGTEYPTAGDAVRGQIGTIVETRTITIPMSDMVKATINADGSDDNEFSRIRAKCETYYPVPKGALVTTARAFGVYEYAEDKTTLVYHASGWNSGNTNYVVKNDSYIRVMENINNSEISQITITIPYSVKKFNMTPSGKDELAWASGEYISKVAPTYTEETQVIDLLGVVINNDGYDASSGVRKSTRYIECASGDVISFDLSEQSQVLYVVFEYDKDRNLVSKKPASGWLDTDKIKQNTFTLTTDGYFRVMQNTASVNGAPIIIERYGRIEPSYIENPDSLQRKALWKNEWFFDIAHRGYILEAPESTRAAYVRAKVHGFNSIEGDIRVTSDGEYVIHHDDGMPSDSSYKISEHTLAELRLNANMGYYKGEAQPILTLDEFVKIGKHLDMTVFIEPKATLDATQIAEVIEIVANNGMSERVIWQLTANDAVTFRGIKSDCRIAVSNVNSVQNITRYMPQFIIEGRPDRTYVEIRSTYVTDEIVQAAVGVGCNVIAWCVTFDWLFPDGWTYESVKTEIKRAIDCGLVGMIVDFWSIQDIYADEYAFYM